jgi:hypothetical protein
MKKSNLTKLFLMLALFILPLKVAGSEFNDGLCSARMIEAAEEKQQSNQALVGDHMEEISMLGQEARNLNDRQKDSALCISYGKRLPWLRDVWPSKAQTFRVSSDGEVDPELISLVERSGNYAYDRLRLFLHNDLPYTVEILLVDASIPRRIDDPFYRSLELCLPTVNSQGVGALSFHGIVILCFDHRTVDKGNLEFLADVQRAVLHEFFHAAQYQMVAPGSNHEESDFVANFGPAWLLEGSAQVFQDIHNKFCTVGGMAFLTSQIHAEVNGIYPYVEYWGEQEIQRGAYEVSHYAVCLLIRDIGIQGLVDFYLGLGEGQSFMVAFRNTFGVNHDDFADLVEDKILSERERVAP